MDDDDLHGDHLLTPSSSTFSQILFRHDDDGDHHHSVFSIGNGDLPKMLCFEGYTNNRPDLLVSETNAVTPQKSVITSSESFSASSSANHSSNKKRCVSAQEVGGGTDCVVTAAGGGGRRQSKKTRSDNPTSTGHAKRKEKLGERIVALQQLVSPFGKTDTASVLHEAMGYIRFLHDQVQVLCSPYLQGDGVTMNMREEAKGELSSRGLCLMPVESTVHVASSNGADFWSPAMGNHVSSSIRH